ncbi:SDR family oxidoreductase [Gordonia neofelifaecis]|uniref:Short-chain dehydrogenase/reductase SDR n=1 Tax=Gordonia neofelifaecis NRRL B-59395 TaxID=644548 RepID=F1YMQ5_9ACTN|nr:SDR family oxidoreductase [Gordonia neofelifaecis]EGD53990.1 short-chain dehydrogenase/reductase SDR [Gordonia neofelifaecis NRRL B-59395]
MPAFDPAGKTVVVTGAGNGIGAGLAVAMGARGANVVVADLDAAGVERTVASITGAGGSAVAAPGDAASQAGVDALIAKAEDAFGPIDAWFANAGVDRGRGLEATDADWDLSWNVNVLAHVHAARRLVPQWVERGGGRFVVTASAAGLLTMLGAPAYSVTKHGAVAFAEWLSATYRHRGVVVQAICPQGVQTRMLDDSGPLEELLSHDVALTVEDVAAAVERALEGEDFLILPHPEVAGYYQARATAPDRWLTGMNRLQQRLDTKLAAEGDDR